MLRSSSNKRPPSSPWTFFLPTLVATWTLVGVLVSTDIDSTAETSQPESELEKVLESTRKMYSLPGISAAYVLANGDLVAAASGFADVEREIPMTTHTRMLAGSIGKTFVAATAAALADEGVLDLDAPVSNWLSDRPWFTRLPNHRSMTLRHLLNHTAGLPDHVHDPAFARALVDENGRVRTEGSAEKWIEFILDQPALNAVGQDFVYSDTGFLVAGLVISSATRRDFEDLVLEKFLEPLQLSSTIPSNRPDLPGLACSYVAADGPLPFPRRTTDESGVMVWDPAIEGAGGGFASTPSDLVRWARWAFEQGPTRLDAVTPVAMGDDGGSYGMGIAFRNGGSHGATAGHSGWIPGTVSNLRYYRDWRVAVAFQINTDDGAQAIVPDLEEKLASLAIHQANRRRP